NFGNRRDQRNRGHQSNRSANSGSQLSRDSGGNPPSVTIHTWLECFNKQKPRSFEKVTAPVDAENWISHMEKIFDVMGCEDAFKTRLAVYKFEGNALAWWKAYKQAKGGDAWLITVTWVEFKKLFFLQRVVIGISRPLNRVVTGTTVIIMTVMDQTGEAVLTTTAAATTTTLATTTGVSSPTDLPILENLCGSFPLCKYVPYCLMAVKMVNTRTDADLSAAVQNALQAMLP
nr:zinc finger, CCHC-type, retrotransposon Gag domain protein [Tanacetum cinerariifolium]